MAAPGRRSADIAALPARLDAAGRCRCAQAAASIVATLFTLVPGTRRRADHLAASEDSCGRSSTKGDFAPGGWGQQLVDELAPADFTVEKIAYSAFYMTRLEWVLRKCGIEQLYCRRHRHQWRRRLDGARRACARVRLTSCWRMAAPPSRTRCIDAAIEALRPVAQIATIAEAMARARRMSVRPPPTASTFEVSVPLSSIIGAGAAGLVRGAGARARRAPSRWWSSATRCRAARRRCRPG